MLLGLAGLFCSCDTPIGDATISKTFIQQYLEPTVMQIRAEHYPDNEPVKIRAYFLGERYGKGNQYVTRDTFWKYAERYGDLDYNKEVATPFDNIALAFPFVRATLVSDTGFDEDHPAGTSLGDIVRIYWSSPYEYIRSGYNDGIGIWKNKLLSELKENDLFLIGIQLGGLFYARELHIDAGITLVLESEPESPGKHTFTFSIVDENGIELTSTCEYTF